MRMSFHTKTITWLTLSSLLLGVGLFTAASGRQALQATEQQRQRLESTGSALQQNRDRAETYGALIERIGWRPGQALRHETIDTTATLADHESDRLNEILRAHHAGKGQFFLRSLTIESSRTSTRREQSPATITVTVKGDNILVLDRP
jgi:hypothetical protein